MRLRAAWSGRPFGWVADDRVCPGGVRQGLASVRHGVRTQDRSSRDGAWAQPFSVACPESAPCRFRTVPASSVETGDAHRVASACSIQGGNTTGVTHEAAKRWVPERSKTRIRRTGCGIEQFPCRRRARQHPISCAGWGGSPTQQWEEFPESPRAALAPVRRGDGRRCIPRIRGADPGLRHRPRSSRRIMRRGIGLFPAHCRPRRDDRGGAGRCVPSHPRGGRASPSCRDRLAA